MEISALTKTGNHVVGAQTIEKSEIPCCKEKPITFFETE